MGLFTDLWGTVKSTFQISIGGVRLKNVSGNLEVRNAADGADAGITVSDLHISGDAFEINSDAAGAAADWKITLQRPAAGMTGHLTFTLPPTDGSPNQVLFTDGNGVLDWASAASTAELIHVDTTTVAFGSGTPVAMFTVPANAVIHQVEVIVDTPYNAGSPTLSVGVAGLISKYMATTENNLRGTAKDRYMAHPGEAAVAGFDMIATQNIDGSGAGSVRVLVYYSVPT